MCLSVQFLRGGWWLQRVNVLRGLVVATAMSKASNQREVSDWSVLEGRDN